VTLVASIVTGAKGVSVVVLGTDGAPGRNVPVGSGDSDTPTTSPRRCAIALPLEPELVIGEDPRDTHTAQGGEEGGGMPERTEARWGGLAALLVVLSCGCGLRDETLTSGFAQAAAKRSAATEKGATEIALFPVVRDGKWGYIDGQGHVVIPLQFDAALPFSEGLAAFGVRRGVFRRDWFKWGYVDQTGAVVIKPQFEKASRFSEGLACVNVGGGIRTDRKLWGRRYFMGGKYGFIDKRGQFVVKPTYTSASGFCEGRAAAWGAGRGAGFIDRSGNLVIEPRYCNTGEFRDGLARVGLIQAAGGSKVGYIDTVGRTVIEFQFDSASGFSEGLALVQVGDLGQRKWGYIDRSGRYVIRPTFDDARTFSEGLAYARRSATAGYIDKTGRFVLTRTFERNGAAFREGMARFYVGKKCGFIDRTGKTVIGEYLLAKMRSMKEDFEGGFLDDIGWQVESEIAADYMGQAERLLAEGQPGKYDHVPAAVLAGAVLEKALRTLCEGHEPRIQTTKANGEPKTMNPMIDDLKKAEVYNEMKAKQLRAWAAVRNHAAHGEFDQFTRGDVEDMISGVNRFLGDELG